MLGTFILEYEAVKQHNLCVLTCYELIPLITSFFSQSVNTSIDYKLSWHKALTHA